MRALVRTPAKADGVRRLGVELFDGDITARETIAAPGCGSRRRVPRGGVVPGGGRATRDVAWRINVDGTRHVLEAMRALEIPKGVYTSTSP